MMTGNGTDNRQQRDRLVKLAFGAGAFVCVLAGLLLYVFAAELGIDPETAQLVAIAFLIAGFADYLVLQFWDRLFRKSGP